MLNYVIGLILLFIAILIWQGTKRMEKEERYDSKD